MAYKGLNLLGRIFFQLTFTIPALQIPAALSGSPGAAPSMGQQVADPVEHGTPRCRSVENKTPDRTKTLTLKFSGLGSWRNSMLAFRSCCFLCESLIARLSRRTMGRNTYVLRTGDTSALNLYRRGATGGRRCSSTTRKGPRQLSSGPYVHC